MAKQIKAIIFDADGMVIKGERFSTRLRERYGVPIESINKFFDNEFKNCILGKADLKVAIEPYLKIWGWDKGIDELLRFWFAESYHIDPKMILQIESLKKIGIKCILATSQEKYRTEYMKREMGFRKLFDEVVSTCEVGYIKTSPEFMNRLASVLLPIRPNETMFWDDRLDNVTVAGAYGFKAHFFKDTNEFIKAVGL